MTICFIHANDSKFSFVDSNFSKISKVFWQLDENPAPTLNENLYKPM